MCLLYNKIEKKLQSTDFQCVGIDGVILNHPVNSPKVICHEVGFLPNPKTMCFKKILYLSLKILRGPIALKRRCLLSVLLSKFCLKTSLRVTTHRLRQVEACF